MTDELLLLRRYIEYLGDESIVHDNGGLTCSYELTIDCSTCPLHAYRPDISTCVGIVHHLIHVTTNLPTANSTLPQAVDVLFTTYPELTL